MPDPTADAVVTDHPERDCYELTVGGETLGLLAYRLRDGVISMDHAEIAPGHAGQGLGGTLARGALDDARARGLTVRPNCPFVADYLRRHPGEYDDLVAPHG